MSVEDLAAVGEQLKHFQLAAVGGHHNVTVTLTQELHIQHFIIVTHKLQEVKEKRVSVVYINQSNVIFEALVRLKQSGLLQIKTKETRRKF